MRRRPATLSLLTDQLPSPHPKKAKLTQEFNQPINHKKLKISEDTNALPTRNCKKVCEGPGYLGIRINGFNVVFVHVPNAFSQKLSKVKDFYKKINNQFLNGKNLGNIDIVMGDTNQHSEPLTLQALNNVIKDSHFVYAHNPNLDLASKAFSSKISPLDGYDLALNGTNSVQTKIFDIAAYNTKTVALQTHGYWSQNIGSLVKESKVAVSMTDHMGLFITIKKPGPA
ncbi:hypothetical protein [Microbulbifer spongiae]|uniref:Endonuclease/exonuclease/phosphatase family protein n=1 Tax=Microbulbifer spongiae TaxID=2944933 RepID=A0ABY9EBE5_9GAMM|nr:hypothetical protein [Microbulbifer sp. MI-G]WKD48665.1 hypothetical protein M8T91_12155 [Microbulbifer sp. MI-G]